jgi:hypothetical protein
VNFWDICPTLVFTQGKDLIAILNNVILFEMERRRHLTLKNSPKKLKNLLRKVCPFM